MDGAAFVAMTRKPGAAKAPNPPSGMLPHDYIRARRVLARRDPVIGALMRAHGTCGLARAQHEDPFRVLVQAIISQQLSTKAARTIGRRLVELHGGALTPQAVAATAEPALRGVGLSTQKLRYLRDLCEKVRDGSLVLHSLTDLPDDEVIAALTQVKGIGRWTAEMFLMFRLHRSDVLPVGDLGILKAVQQAYGLRKPPTATRLMEIGEPWRPYRSVACWYLWASLGNPPGQD
jgi:DNA-3-methyladenine glycosylase II